MATNKHAIIRYQELDKCFRNTAKRFYIEDLLEACNNALYEFDGQTEGIKKRQLYDDIKFMESEQGWSVPLEKVKDGRRAYYRYEDANFSINNQPINTLEADQLKAAILVLNRFKGLPQFEWVHELIPKLDQTFGLEKENSKEIISFDINEYVEGTEFIQPLFQAIQQKQVVEVKYRSFTSHEAVKILFHPYHLKQYNNRWYLFGKDESYPNLVNLALDRIEHLELVKMTYDTTAQQDYNAYFDDIIGVTRPRDGELIKITMWASNHLAPYIKTKPIHGSQKRMQENEDGYTFSIEVIPNYELEKLLLSFGEQLKVIAPKSVQDKLKERLQKQLNNY